MLLGLTGKAGAGKNTVADVLSDVFNFQQTAFADPLKTAAALIFGLDVVYFYDSDLKEVKDQFWNMTPREMLQKLGTEACRNNIDQDIWVKSMQRSCAVAIADGDDLVITDVRFENEAEMIRNLGGRIIHIESNRGSKLAEASQMHASEAGVVRKPSDFLLRNNGSLKDLKETVALGYLTLMEDADV